jgi:hypothetical protein
MGDNDRGYNHPNAIDKGIKHVDVSAGTEMPPGMLSMTPLSKTPTMPTGVVPGPSISADLRSALSSSGNPARRQRVLDVAGRK